MFLRHRGTLTLLTLIVLAAVAITGGISVWNAPIDPAMASRGQLMRSLVLRDLSAEPLEAQRAWVDRLQRELQGEFESQGTVQLSERYRQRLAQNVLTLQNVWFRTRTAQYASLPAEQRTPFLLDQLALVASWTKLASVLDSGPVPPEAGTKMLIQRLEAWLSEAEGTEREQMAAIIRDGTICWLSTTDLAQQPLAVRTELALRLARELDRGSRPAVGSLVADPERQSRLAHNAAQLVEAYVYHLADSYAELPSGERLKFVDNQLATVERWGVAELLSSAPASGSAHTASRAVAAMELARHTQVWIEHAPPEKKESVEQFVRAVQARLVWKQLPAWLRGEQAAR